MEFYKHSLLVVLFGLQIISVICVEYPTDFGESLCTSSETLVFDIILAGAGSAGSVLAGRLSEEASFNILLIEYGEDPPVESNVPLYWATHLMKSRWDYQYISETNGEYFQGLKYERSSIPRGKTLGGSSAVNCAIYLRPTPRDMERWTDVGIDGWNYNDTLYYSLKAESFHDKERFDKLTHNTDGYLDVSPFFAPDPLIPVFSEGLREIGLNKLNDLNVQYENGFGSTDSTTRNGIRSSTAKAYLSPAVYRKNLFIARKTLVQKVLVDSQANPKRAIGVEIIAQNGVTCQVHARKEVILSLGTIGSPQVLLLSGIGPTEHLQELGIETIVDLPVGKSYQDHVIFPMVFSDRKTRPENEIRYESLKLINDTFVLLNEGLATLGLTQLMTFINTKNMSLPWHDIQIMKMRISRGTSFQTLSGFHKMYNMFGWSDESAHLVTELNDMTDTIFLLIILSEVKSTDGYIKLKSLNVVDHPLIQTNLLSDPEDVETLLAGVKFGRDLANSKAVREYGLQLERLDFKLCKEFDFESDEYWACAIKQVATGFYHPSSTVKIGTDDDESAVLTSQMKVKGFANLRVCDAANMPMLVARNPNGAVIMMAEKLADMVKLEYNKTINYKTNLFR